MKKQWILGCALMLVAGCDDALGIESAEMKPEPEPAPECTSDAECENQDTACSKFRCEEGACQRHDMDLGFVVMEQVADDCKRNVCDGQGEVTTIDFDDAVPDDNPCTREECIGSELRHTPIFDSDVPCYTGPSGTEGVGICRAGVVECSSQGEVIGCKGEILPQTEVCETLMDENCNGVAALNEGCACGDGIMGGTEECDDGNTSNADDCSSVCKVQRVVEISAGAGHVCALLSDGRAKCWGRDDLGELGNPNNNQWLGNAWDSAGKNAEMGANLPAINFNGRAVKHISVQEATTCAAFEDGGLKCWGLQHHGTLGQPTPIEGVIDGPANIPDINLGGGKAIAVAGSHAHKCALFENGTVKCWGYNGEGALGLADDDFADHLVPTNAINFNGEFVTAISSGLYHNCALFNSGAVRCWGYNANGELGRNTTTHYGRYQGQMGADLKPIALGQPAIAIATGSRHSCALLANHKMKCWGYNAFGQLGQGHAYTIGDQPNEMESLPPVNLVLPAGLTISGIHAAARQTCAIISTAACDAGATINSIKG